MALADGVSPGPSSSTADGGIGKLKTAADLNKKFEKLIQDRGVTERQWQLNLTFYKGKQYSYYNKSSNMLQTLPVDDGEKPRFRVRIVANQIVGGTQSLLAKMLKTRPQMMASPGSGSNKDLQAAEMAERLLEYWWDDFQLDDNLEEAMLWGIIAGQGYWKVCWDEHAGRQMSFLLDPYGQPVLEDDAKSLYRSMLEQNGIQPQEKVVYLGDIKVETVSPFDIYLDPSVKKFTDCKWLMHVSYMEPDQIKAMYGVQLAPDSVTGSKDASMPMGAQDKPELALRKTVTLYALPTATLPKGRIVTWSGKNILSDTPWTYPTHDLPFVKFPGLRIPGEVYDGSIVEQAIPLQKELNRTISQIVEYKNLTIKPRVWAPIGSLRTRLTDEPGAVYEYNPIGGMRPEIEQLAGMPSYVFEHLSNIQQRLADIFYATDVTDGKVPPNVEAGVAIDLLQEQATDRLAPMIRMMELSLARAGRLMLALAKHYYIEPRMVKIRGSSGSQQVKSFTNADIDGAISVHVETGSALPRTRAGRMARIESFVQMGLIDGRRAYKYLDMADMHGLTDQLEADEDQAWREHDKLDKGTPVNPVAMIQAQQEVMQAQNDPQHINPDSGQPFQSPQEFQEWAQAHMQNASLQPGTLDDHATHLDVHGQLMKSVDFEALPQDVQARYVQHVSAHREVMFSMPGQTEPASAPRVSLQIKGTTGPTITSKILEKSGIFTNPQEASEPPIPDWVTENIQPGEDAAGNVQQTQMGQMLIQQQQAQLQALKDQHAIQMANLQQEAQVQSQAQQMEHTIETHNMGVAQQQAEQGRQAQLHAQKLRAAKAQADAAEAKARLAKNPPKPASGR